MSIVFFGSKNSSAEFLKKLAEKEKIAGVVTCQDKPSGRGLKIQPSPVKLLAQKNEIPVIELNGLLSSGIKPDLGVVVAYGRILKKEVFSVPLKGTMNVHFSLLPKYRGASPMQWAIINGEKTTGVTTFFIDEGLDTGKIILQKEVAIDDKDDFITLEKKLVDIGIQLLNDSVELIRSGRCAPKQQIGEPTFAPPLKKSDGEIKWGNKTAVEICNLIRGTKPWPGAYTKMNVEQNRIFKILKAQPIEPVSGDGISWKTESVAGEISAIVKAKGFIVKCKSGCLLVENVQRESGKPVSAWDFWQGAQLKIGDKFVL